MIKIREWFCEQHRRLCGESDGEAQRACWRYLITAVLLLFGIVWALDLHHWLAHYAWGPSLPVLTTGEVTDDEEFNFYSDIGQHTCFVSGMDAHLGADNCRHDKAKLYIVTSAQLSKHIMDAILTRVEKHGAALIVDGYSAPLLLGISGFTETGVPMVGLATDRSLMNCALRLRISEQEDPVWENSKLAGFLGLYGENYLVLPRRADRTEKVIDCLSDVSVPGPLGKGLCLLTGRDQVLSGEGHFDWRPVGVVITHGKGRIFLTSLTSSGWPAPPWPPGHAYALLKLLKKLNPIYPP